MLHRLSKPMRQTIAVLLAVAALGLAAVAVVVPVTTRVAQLEDDVSQERSVLGRLDELVSNAPKEGTTPQAPSLGASGFAVTGDSTSIRQALLQSELSGIVAAKGLKPRSAHALPPREHGSLKLIGTQVQLVATLTDVQAVMIAIEGHKPALFIEALDIVRSSSSGLPNDDGDDKLDARFDVYAVAMGQ